MIKGGLIRIFPPFFLLDAYAVGYAKKETKEHKGELPLVSNIDNMDGLRVLF
jgi:hypothetical protein